MHDSWRIKLKPLSEVAKIASDAVMHRKVDGAVVYPTSAQRFAAFNMPFDSVKVVIIGQDPYHGPNQANGLAFSVNRGVTIPPSLVNIYKELQSDLGIKPPSHGDLTPWVNQGVLLLNTSLTVEAGKPASHKDIGWMPFTKGVVDLLNKEKDNLVFILWGKHAQQFTPGIDRTRHVVLESAHPSPFSCDRGFFGSKPFSSTNANLITFGKSIVNWEIK
jgi:uracil-DNA glycosylase